MSDLDQLHALFQEDTQSRLARAAQIDQRLASAASIVESYRDHPALHALTPDLPIGLILPPELQGVGELAALLAPRAAVPIGQTPVTLGVEPRANLYIGDQAIDLGAHVSVNAHPTQALLVLIGLITVTRGEVPSFPVPESTVMDALARCVPAIPTNENPAKQIALRVHERIPCFWGAGIEAAAARDWAIRRLWLSESMALATDQDELSRLWVMARFPRFWPNAAAFVRLVTPGSTGELAQQISYLLSRRRFSTLDVQPPQTVSPLIRAIYWLELGEWNALYAAALNNVDPAAQVPRDLLFGA